MISFRFHIVSIVAVFLGIAIGVVVGSTFVDRAIVDNLQDRIRTVSANLDERRDDMARLEDEGQNDDRFIEQSAEFAVTDRLTDVPVLVIATRGVDEGAVEQMAHLAERAGAAVPGVLWIEPKWSLDNDQDAAELASILDRADATSDELRLVAVTAVATELAPAALPGEGSTTTTTTVASEPPTSRPVETPTTTIPAAPTVVTTALLEAGFFDLETIRDGEVPALDQVIGDDPRILVVAGAKASERTIGTVNPLVTALVTAGSDVVVADLFEANDDGVEPGETIRELLDDTVEDSLVIVDSAAQITGRVSAVLSLDAVANGVTGHFGIGPGADGPVPAWSPP